MMMHLLLLLPTPHTTPHTPPPPSHPSLQPWARACCIGGGFIFVVLGFVLLSKAYSLSQETEAAAEQAAKLELEKLQSGEQGVAEVGNSEGAVEDNEDEGSDDNDGNENENKKSR
jgi:hypothetical protein